MHKKALSINKLKNSKENFNKSKTNIGKQLMNYDKSFDITLILNKTKSNIKDDASNYILVDMLDAYNKPKEQIKMRHYITPERIVQEKHNNDLGNSLYYNPTTYKSPGFINKVPLNLINRVLIST